MISSGTFHETDRLPLAVPSGRYPPFMELDVSTGGTWALVE